MGSSGVVDEFNAVSRESLYYRIHKLAFGKDWEYDYETFVHRGPAMVRCILKRLQCVHDSEGILLVEYSGVPVLIYDCEVRIPVAVHFAKVRQSSDVQL